MKVKLLRKVRKEFSIMYFPNGYGWYSDKSIMILFDKQGEVIQHINVTEAHNKNYAYDYLHGVLIEKILKKYKKYGTRRLKKNGDITKMWYNENNIN